MPNFGGISQCLFSEQSAGLETQQICTTGRNIPSQAQILPLGLKSQDECTRTYK